MAGTVHRDTPLRCQPTVSNEEPRPFHSWSRINSAGQIVLRDALHILQSPSVVTSMTSNCRKWGNVGELETFLRELRQEGHRPTVLHSKDVYRYRSCMTLPLSVGNPPERGGGGNKLTGKRKSGKKRKRPVSKQHPSWSTTERAKPRIKGIRPPDSLMDHRALLYGSIRVASTASRNTGSPPVVVPRAQPCLRLTNIAGLTGGHTARLQIQTCWDSDTNSTTQQQQNSLTFSGIPSQPSQNGRQPSQNGSRSPPTTAVALLNQKTLSSCPIRMDGGALIGDSAPVIYANGHIFPETDMELTLTRRRNGSHWPQGGHKQQNGLPSGHGVVENGVLNVLKSKNYLRRKVIKIDDSRSLAEARRVAQNILQLNLSPVIQIQPFILRDFRPQYQ